MIDVQECQIGYHYAYGLTDGTMWAFHAYETRTQAEAMLASLSTPQRIKRVVSYPNPQQIVYPTKEYKNGAATFLVDVVTQDGMRTMYVDFDGGWSGYARHEGYVSHIEGVEGIQRGWIRQKWECDVQARQEYIDTHEPGATYKEVKGWMADFDETDYIVTGDNDLTYIRALCVYLSEYTMLDHFGIRVCVNPKTEATKYYSEAYLVVIRKGAESYRTTWEAVQHGKDFFRRGWKSAQAVAKQAQMETARALHLAKPMPRKARRTV